MTVRAALFGLTALTLAVVALSTGSQLYYLLLLCMVMMLLIGLLSAATALFTLRVNSRAGRIRLARGESAPLEMTVRYVSLLPVRAVVLTLSVPEDERAAEHMRISLPPLAARRLNCAFECPHRGVYHIGVAGVAVEDIFSLFRFSKRVRGAQTTVEVLPNAAKLPPIELRSGDTGPQALARQTEDYASPSDTRGYLPGDPLKKVHWKLSIRRRELLVRTYEEASRPDTLILPDLSPMNFMHSQAMTVQDCVCETAASIARAQLEAGYPVRMPLMSAEPAECSGASGQELDRFTDQLMRVKFDSPYPYEQVLTLEMRRMQRTAGAVLITARLTARIADIALQLRRSGLRVCVCYITESRREESMALLERLRLSGLIALRVDPWGKGLTEEMLLYQV